jgi:PAS domain S-box-containing protein
MTNQSAEPSKLKSAAVVRAKPAMLSAPVIEKQIVEQGAESIFVSSPEGNIRKFNAQLLTLSGFSKSEMRAMSVQSLYGITTEEYEVMQEWVREHLSYRSANRTIKCKDGSSVAYDLMMIYMSDGSAIHFLRDIRVQRSEEDALRENEEVLRMTMNAALDAIITLDESGIIKGWNPQAETIFGWSAAEAINQPFAELIIPPALRGESGRDFQAYLATDDGLMLKGRTETEALSKHGFLFPVELSVTVIWIKSSLRYSVFARDITDQKSIMRRQVLLIQDLQTLNRQLVAAKSMAEESAKAKEQFVATMSHEIRTPLNAVIGFTQLLTQTSLSLQQSEYLRAITQSSELLLNIVNDILDFSKLQAGKVELDEQAFDLPRLLDDTAELFSSSAAQKGLSLHNLQSPELPQRVIGDNLKVRQTLVNLLGNAIKFTRHGSVTFSSELLSQTADAVRVRFSVMDTGIGISDEQLPSIFESFSQATRGTTREYGGTGLGLTIAKALVELLGGTITVQSTAGEGSCFSFEIPLKLAATLSADSSALADMPQGDFSHLRALIVEDNEMNQIVAENSLKLWNMSSDAVDNGFAALRRLEEMLQQNTFYDIVLLDIQMPELDGYETARRIRAHTDARIRALPVLAMTASALSGEYERCIAAGMNDHIAKPFQLADLHRKISRLTSRDLLSPADLTPALLDLDYVRTISNGDIRFVKKILTLFVRQSADLMVDLSQAIEQADFTTIRGRAHKLKSTLNLLGLRLAIDLCESIERSAAAQQADGIAENIAQLDEACRHARREAEQILTTLPTE